MLEIRQGLQSSRWKTSRFNDAFQCLPKRHALLPGFARSFITSDLNRTRLIQDFYNVSGGRPVGNYGIGNLLPRAVTPEEVTYWLGQLGRGITPEAMLVALMSDPLYFTQSRGTMSGLRVEERLGELLLGVPFDPLQAAPPLEQYLGYYWEGEGDLYRAIVRDGADLALEIIGRAVVPLDFIGEDRWKLRPEPATVLAFDRDESGAVVGYHIGDHVEVRVTPRAGLPDAGEVAARVAATHQVERLEGRGVVRLQSTIDMPKLARSGESVMWLEWPDRWRVDESVGEDVGHSASDGGTMRLQLPKQEAAPVEGEQAAFMRQSNPFLRSGDWRRDGTRLIVLQELGQGDERVLLVRAGDCSAPATTLYVGVESGRLEGVSGLTFLPGMGRIGEKVRFSDWRDVGGALLPGRVEVELAHPLIGRIVSVVQQVDVGVEVPEGHFALAD